MFRLSDLQAITFLELRKTLVSLTDRSEEFERWAFEIAQAKAGNEPPREPPLKRKFQELKNTDDLNQRCFGHKTCALALLPASTVIDYEEQNFNEQIALIEKLDQQAGNMPIHYQWVNATCHRDFVKKLDVDPLMLPSIIYYQPNTNKQAKLIGTFDEDTLKSHQDKLLTGRLPIFETLVPQSELTLEDIDCKSIQMEQEAQDDDFDEILAEILAEEAARNEERNKEEATQTKKTKKGKKKKGKKAKAKDEL